MWTNPTRIYICGDTNWANAVITTAGGNAKDYNIYIVKNGVIQTTQNKNQSANWPTTQGYRTYAGLTDLWGLSWVKGDLTNSSTGLVLSATNGSLISMYLNATNFGASFPTYANLSIVGIAFQAQINKSGTQARVNCIQMQVNYSYNAPPTVASVKANYTNSTLIGNCTATTDDTQARFNYQWWKDGSLNSTGTYSTATNSGVEVNVANVTSPSPGWWNFSCQVNDTLNQTSSWSNSSAAQVIFYGALNVSLTAPPDNTGVNPNATFYLNATITCNGVTGAVCGNVSATARYNASSASPDTAINATSGGVPFWIVPQGTSQLWNTTIDPSSSDDWVGDVAVDGAGNVIVTGTLGAGPNGFYTVKYNSSGSQLWNATDYVLSGYYHEGNGVAVDAQGNVIVTGNAWVNGTQWFTVKYNSSGSQLWNTTLHPTQAYDNANAVAVDAGGDIIVTGLCDGCGALGSSAIYTVKYNSSGSQLWNATNDPSSGQDTSSGVAVDNQSNIIVTGYQNYGAFYTVKYNSSGSQLWNATFEPSGCSDHAEDVAVDGSGNIIITGYSPCGDGSEWFTVKYNSSGSQLWNVSLDPTTGDDEARSVAVDSQGNIFVAGFTSINAANQAFYMVKYNSSGSQVWNLTNDPTTTRDDGVGIALDNQSNIIVAGNANGTGALGGVAFYTAKYTQAGVNPLTTSLSQGQSWNVSWLVNATGATYTQYYVDALFNSSYANVTSNDTANARVCIGSCPGPPAIGSVVLNSTNGTNTSQENLTAWPQNVTDPDNDTVNLIYDWRLNGTSIAIVNMNFDVNNSNGTGKVRDYTTHHNDGNVSYLIWNATGGRNGSGAYQYTGYNGIFVPHNPSLNVSTITAAVWFKAHPDTNGYGLIGKQDWTGGEWSGLFEVAILSDNTTQFKFHTADGWNYLDSGPVPRDEWIHIAATYDGSVATIYINGVANATTTANGPLVDNYTSPLGFGGINGSVDEVQVFNRSLSAAQVKALYENKPYLLTSDETSVGDNWTACVTPNDGAEDGNTTCSNALVVQSAAPSLSSVILNSTSGTNTTAENLTAYPQNVTDPNNDTVRLLYDWRVNGTSIAVLNMNFDVKNSAGTNKTRDYSTFSNNGTVYSATWNATGGWNGSGAYHFKQSDLNYISVADNSSLDIAGNFSIEAWVKRDSTGSYMNIVAKERNPENSGYGMYFGSDDRIYLFFNAGSGWSDTYTSATYTSTSAWYHVIGTHTSGTQKIYVNGQEQTLGGGGSFSGNPANSGNPLYIGRNSAYVEYFDGFIDNVRVYNRTLTPAQVSALYNNQTNRIVSQELSVGQNWTACATPNNGNADGSTVCSNSLIISSGTCTYGGSGNWLVQGADNCVITSAVDLNLKNLTCNGTGTMKVRANVTNFTAVTAQNGCGLSAELGGQLRR